MVEQPRSGPRTVRIVRRAGKLGLTLLAVLVLVATGYGWRAYRNLNQGVQRTDVIDHGGRTTGDRPEAVALDHAVDILLVGKDSRTDAQGDPLPKDVLRKLHIGHADGKKHTDTMILVHIPQNGKSAVAFSFPRDAYVRIPGGYGRHRLNTAYAIAYNNTIARLAGNESLSHDEAEHRAAQAARKKLINTIEQFLGRPGMIDRYAEVNLAGFYHITKALDGVKVCLTHPVREENSGIDLPAGPQTINARQALAFVRQRHGLDSGLDRVERQQAFLSSVAHELLSAEVLLNPSRLADLISAIQRSVVLSSGWDLWRFAAQLRRLSGDDISFYTVPVTGPATIGGASVLLVDRGEVRAFVAHKIADSTDQAPLPRAGGGAGGAATGNTAGDDTDSDGNDPPRSNTGDTTESATDSPPANDPITAGGIPCVD